MCNTARPHPYLEVIRTRNQTTINFGVALHDLGGKTTVTNKSDIFKCLKLQGIAPVA